MLARYLASVKELVNAINITDTGSTNPTNEIRRQYTDAISMNYLLGFDEEGENMKKKKIKKATTPRRNSTNARHIWLREQLSITDHLANSIKEDEITTQAVEVEKETKRKKQAKKAPPPRFNKEAKNMLKKLKS